MKNENLYRKLQLAQKNLYNRRSARLKRKLSKRAPTITHARNTREDYHGNRKLFVFQERKFVKSAIGEAEIFHSVFTGLYFLFFFTSIRSQKY